MFTSDALQILRHADRRFSFGKQDDASQGYCRFLELSVHWNGRHVGHLEHNEMPGRGNVVAGDAVLETMGRMGDPWTPENKARGWRPYYRKTWRRCFREIIGSVPDYVERRIRRQIRRAGFRL